VTDIFIQFQLDLEFLTDFSYKSPTLNFTRNSELIQTGT